MIIPSNRLILFAAVILPPCAALGAVWPPALTVTALLTCALVAVAIWDAFGASRVLSGLRVEAPPYGRLFKNRLGTVELLFIREGREPSRITAGLSFPAAIDCTSEIQEIVLPKEDPVSKVEWSCTPSERGRFRLESITVEALSPMGLWHWRERRPLGLELRVYPDLTAEKQRVAALFLRRGMFGAHSQRRAGQGREFEKLREYLPGDSLSDVHWKASAKRSQLATKVHQIERSHEVYVIVDASRLSARPVSGDSKLPVLERYVTAALILGAAAERQGDQFGLITFSDRILTFLRARNGPAHFDTCRDRLYTLQPQPVTPDFEELCAFLRQRLNKRALLVFLTALDDPFLAESFTTSSQLLARHHLMLVNMMRPPGVRPLFENGEVFKMDDLYAELGGHLQWEQLRELERVLHRRGIRFNLLDPVMIAAELVKQHAEVRERELL